MEESIRTIISTKYCVETKICRLLNLFDKGYDEDESDDDSISMVDWTYRGKNYLMDESTNIIYDISKKEVGNITFYSESESNKT
jgi:hypothetical protein